MSNPTIYIKQQGAGTGKTYAAIGVSMEEQFKDIDVFIYMTKTNSVKTITRENKRIRISRKPRRWYRVSIPKRRRTRLSRRRQPKIRRPIR